MPRRINGAEGAGKNSGGFNLHLDKISVNAKRNTEIDINGNYIHKLYNICGLLFRRQ